MAAPKDWRVGSMKNWIGGSLIVGFLGALGLLFWHPIPGQNEQLIIYMLGQLSGFVSGVIASYFVLAAGARELEAKRVENTAKMLDTIGAATASTPNRPAGTPDDPVSVAEVK